MTGNHREGPAQPGSSNGAPTPKHSAPASVLDIYAAQSALAKQRHLQTVERLRLEGDLQARRFRRRFATLAVAGVALIAVVAAQAFPWGSQEWKPNEGVAFLQWQREHGSTGKRFAANHPELAATFNGNWPTDHRARLEQANLKNCNKAACVPAVIRAIFPDNTEDAAVAISGCETGGTYNPRASGDGGDSLGVFQVNRAWWGETWVDADRLFEPWHNTQVALRISGAGTDWHHWWICSGKLGLR